MRCRCAIRMQHLHYIVSNILNWRLWFQIIAETLEARRTLQEVQDRHMELLKLEKSIQELRDMFVEMALLVEKQVRNPPYDTIHFVDFGWLVW